VCMCVCMMLVDIDNYVNRVPKSIVVLIEYNNITFENV